MSMENAPWSKAVWPWQELRGIHLEPIMLNHGHLPGPASNQTACHPFYTWWWLEKGSVTLTIDGLEHLVPARHWVLIPVGLTRHQFFSSDAVVNSINFVARWLNGLPILRLPALVKHKAEATSSLVKASMELHRAAGTPLSSQFVSLENRQLSLGGGVRCFAALNRFVACLLDQPALRDAAHCSPVTGDARLDRVFDHLLRNLRAGPLPYADWKRFTGLSRPHLDRLAHAHLGHSLRQHRDHLLLSDIHRRLSIDHSSIKLHALDLGFVDSAHFCRWVRRQSGLSPKMLASSST